MLVTSFLLVLAVPTALSVVGLMLVVVIWASTAFAMVPGHRRLLGGHDDGTVARLVRNNWVRTVAWSLRVPVALVLLSAPSTP